MNSPTSKGRRGRVRRALSGVAVVLLNRRHASADNCTSLSDCCGGAQAAAVAVGAIAVAVALLALGRSAIDGGVPDGAGTVSTEAGILEEAAGTQDRDAAGHGRGPQNS
jgi:hypothetical protein